MIQEQLSSLSGAVADLNKRVEAIQLLQERLINASTLIEDRADDLRSKQADYQHWKDEQQAKREAAEDQASQRSEIATLASLMEDHSSAHFIQASERFSKTQEDLDQALHLGFLSDREYTEALKNAEEKYKDLKAAAEGKAILGQAGADLFRLARHPVTPVASAVGDQISGIASGLMGLLDGLPIMGGLWGLLMHGYTEMDRLAAEAGEVANIVAATGETSLKGATQYFASFQEQAQKFMGISRQEVQGILRTFVDAGLTVEDILSAHKDGIGQVGHDAMTLTLALDKHLEWPGGQTAQLAVGLIKENGLSVSEAVDSLQRMIFSAQGAGLAIEEFIQVATHTSSELAKFGVDAEGVSMVMMASIDRYKEIGISADAAQRIAQLGVEQVSAGLNQASVGMKAMLSSEMGLGDDLDAVYALQDAVKNRDQKRFGELIRSAYRISREKTANTGGGSADTRQRDWLESTFGFEGARMIVEVGRKMEEQGGVKSLDSKGWEGAKDALSTEAEKVSSFQRSKEKILQGMADMGRGLFQLISNFAAIMIISIKALMSVDYAIEGGAWVAGKLFGAVGLGEQASGMVRALGGNMDGRAERVASIKAQYDTYLRQAEHGAIEVLDGAKKAGSGVEQIFGPILQPVTRALKFKIGSGTYDDGPVHIADDEERIQQALLESGDAVADFPPMESGGEIAQVKSRQYAPEVVNMALGQTGNIAKGSEPNKYSRGRAEWWCMDFVGWAYEQIGYSPWGEFTDSMWGTYKYKAFRGMEAWGRDKGFWRNPEGYVPKPGDIFFLERWSGSSPGEGDFIGEHVGMVVDILPDGRLWTIEGNAVHNGVNGVWSHARDPSKSIFRGFVTTEKSGRSQASQSAKEKYIRMTLKTREKKKRAIEAKKIRRLEDAKQVARKIEKAAEAQGTYYSSTEALVSSVQDVQNASPKAGVNAQLMSTPTGPRVEVQVSLDDLAGMTEIKIESGSVKESLR